MVLPCVKGAMQPQAQLPAKERAAIREEVAARIQQLQSSIAMNLPFPPQVLQPGFRAQRTSSIENSALTANLPQMSEEALGGGGQMYRSAPRSSSGPDNQQQARHDAERELPPSPLTVPQGAGEFGAPGWDHTRGESHFRAGPLPAYDSRVQDDEDALRDVPGTQV